MLAPVVRLVGTTYGGRARIWTFGFGTLFLLVVTVPNAAAIHWHTACTAASGNVGDVPTGNGAVVTVGLDYYQDGTSKTPVTKISAGESVTWTWDPTSPYCHSVTGAGWGSPGVPGGRLHPAGAEPSLPLLLVTGPEFWPDPTNPPGAPLSFTRVFPASGTFIYSCAEHNLIGLQGVVVVSA